MRGVTAACLKEWGNFPSANERFASSAINSEKTDAHDLTSDGGMRSADEDFGGRDLRMAYTSAEVTRWQV